MTPAMDTYLWTAGQAMAATGGVAQDDWHVEGISIDSRMIEPGDMFVAIRGPRFDGHDFTADAIAAGATVSMVDHHPGAVPTDAPLLEVKDTTLALEDMARAARQRTSARVIAVTGSVGKTGTKEGIRLALEDQGPTVASLGSLNNHWGVPLSLARLPADTAFGVFEIGMNHPDEITPLSQMVRPDVAVITNVEAVHSAFFDSVEQIADAKAEIFDGMGADGIAVLNRDNEQFDRLRKAAIATGLKTIIGFGIHPEAEVLAVDVRTDGQGSDIKAMINGVEIEYRLGVPGRHWVNNSLAILAAVNAAGADIRIAAQALGGMTGLKGRGQRHTVEIPGGTFVVIDESYNASPVSMNAALEVLGQIQPDGGGRRIAVLGDMLELGTDWEAKHAGLVEILIAQKINLVFTAGQYMDALWDVLPKSMRGANDFSALNLGPKVTAMVRPGDVVVVKGSHGSNTGPIVEALLDMAHSKTLEPAAKG